MSISRLIFLKVLLLLASAMVASAQRIDNFQPPVLTSLGALTPKVGSIGMTLTAPATFTAGNGTNFVATASYSGPPGGINATLTTEGGIRMTIPTQTIHFTNYVGPCRLEAITFSTGNGVTVYNRNGTISHVFYPAAELANTHTFDFSALDFTVVDASSLPQIATQPVNVRTMAGQSASFSITVNSTIAATIQWRKNGVAIPGASQSQINFASATTADAGAYDAVVTTTAGSVTSTAATLIVDAGRIKNISVRIVVPETEPLTAGLVIDTAKTVLVRGVGRSLEQFGVPAGTTMVNPRIDVVNSSGTVVAQNDDAVASSTLTSATTRAGAFPLSSAQDSALVVNLPAGAYTVRLREATGRSGDALLEVYDVD